MSASLVGSEMCIRDRFPTQRVLPLLIPGLAVLNISRRLSGDKFRQGADRVIEGSPLVREHFGGPR
eukprot:2797057-Alexandrium_andersonii.AAC.1